MILHAVILLDLVLVMSRGPLYQNFLLYFKKPAYIPVRQQDLVIFDEGGANAGVGGATLFRNSCTLKTILKANAPFTSALNCALSLAFFSLPHLKFINKFLKRIVTDVRKIIISWSPEPP